MDGTYPQLPPLYRDSEGLRTNMIAERNKFTSAQTADALSYTPHDFHENLRQWAELPVKAVLLPRKSGNPERTNPADPTLSYMQSGPESSNGIVQSNEARHENFCSQIVSEFMEYTNRLLSSAYEDVSDFRQHFQYEMSGIETQFGYIVDDCDKTPQELIQAICEAEKHARDFLFETCEGIEKNSEMLINAVENEAKRVISALIDQSCTAEKVNEYIQRPLDDFEGCLAALETLSKDFTRSSDARIQMTIADYNAEAARVMCNRRKRTTEVLIRDFRLFLIQQNEWSHPLVESLNDCNCESQQMAGGFHDRLAEIEGAGRTELYAFVEVFLQNRGQNRVAIDALHETFSNVKRTVIEAKEQTESRLREISMPGSTYCDEIVTGWEKRWEKRIARLCEANNKQLESNSFYICGIMAVFNSLEKLHTKACDAERSLRAYFDETVSAVENRFQRDLERYSAAISGVEREYSNIWSPDDARRMSTIAGTLIDAAYAATERREEQLVSLLAGPDSALVIAIRDTMIDLLKAYAELLVASDLELVGYESKGSVNWDNDRIQVPLLDQLIAERNADVAFVQDEVHGSTTEYSETDYEKERGESSKQAKNASPSRSAQAKRDTAKQKGRENHVLGENGLYAELPSFSNIDQTEFLKEYGFFYNSDGLDEQAIRDAILAVLVSPGDKKKDVKKSKGEVQPAALEDINLAAAELELSSSNGNLVVQMNTVTDMRVVLHLALLHNLEEEGRRIAFNRSREAFFAQVEQWRSSYIEILNEVAEQSVAEQMEKYQREKAAVEKRNKAKKGEPEEPLPEPPQKPEPITELSEDVEERLLAISIPDELRRSESEIHTTLMYCLLDYDQLREIPSNNYAYAIEVEEMMYEDTDGIDPTPNVSGPPTRPGTGKSPEVTKKQDKTPKESKPKIELPLPEGIKQFLGDSRLVTHGQSAILQIVFNEVLKVELQRLLERTQNTLEFYMKEGESIRERSSIDTYRLQLQFESHRMRYVQENLEKIQLEFARRNGISVRLLDRCSRLVSNLQLRYIHTDTRFKEFKDYSFSIFGLEKNASPIASAKASPERSKSAKKKVDVELPAKLAGDQILARASVSEYFELYFDEEENRISGFVFNDELGQNIPLLRVCADEFKCYFVTPLIRAVSEQPEILHKVIIQQQKALIAAITGRISKQLLSDVDSRLEAFLGEIEQKLPDIKRWGNESGEPVDFGFANETVAFLLNNYDTPPRLVEEPHEQPTAHPTHCVCEAIEVQAEMLREDIQSKFAQDVYLIKNATEALADAAKACNVAEITQNDKLMLVKRETSSLSATILGRITSVCASFETVRSTVLSIKKQFAGSNAELSSFSNFYDLAIDFVDSFLLIEHERYLLGYERSLSDIAYSVPVVYCPAMELYEQREKALNHALSLFAIEICALNEQYGGNTNAEKLHSLFQRSEQYIESKNFVLKNKIYVDNSAVDILTEFQCEFRELMAKFPGVRLQSPETTRQTSANEEPHYVGDNVGSMVAELERRLDISREGYSKLSDILVGLYKEIITASEKLAVAVVRANFSKQESAYNEQISDLQNSFLRQFDGFYLAVRPALAKYPEKQKEILEEAGVFYNEQKELLDTIASEEKFTFEREYLLFSALVNSVLLSFEPFEQGSLECCLELCSYVEEFAAPERDTRSKTPAEEPVRYFLNEEFIPEEPKQSETFPAVYLRVLKIMSASFAAKRTVFAYEQIDEKVLATLKEATPFESLLFDKPPRIIEDDAEPSRSFVAVQAKSEKGERKGEPSGERMQMPSMVSVGIESLVLAQPDPKASFELEVQCLVSTDAETVKFAIDCANSCFGLCFDNRKCYDSLISSVKDCQELDKKVFDEFVESVNAVSLEK